MSRLTQTAAAVLTTSALTVGSGVHAQSTDAIADGANDAKNTVEMIGNGLKSINPSQVKDAATEKASDAVEGKIQDGREFIEDKAIEGVQKIGAVATEELEKRGFKLPEFDILVATTETAGQALQAGQIFYEGLKSDFKTRAGYTFYMIRPNGQDSQDISNIDENIFGVRLFSDAKLFKKDNLDLNLSGQVGLQTSGTYAELALNTEYKFIDTENVDIIGTGSIRYTQYDVGSVTTVPVGLKAEFNVPIGKTSTLTGKAEIPMALRLYQDDVTDSEAETKWAINYLNFTADF